MTRIRGQQRTSYGQEKNWAAEERKELRNSTLPKKNFSFSLVSFVWKERVHKFEETQAKDKITIIIAS